MYILKIIFPEQPSYLTTNTQFNIKVNLVNKIKYFICHDSYIWTFWLLLFCFLIGTYQTLQIFFFINAYNSALYTVYYTEIFRLGVRKILFSIFIIVYNSISYDINHIYSYIEIWNFNISIYNYYLFSLWYIIIHRHLFSLTHSF